MMHIRRVLRVALLFLSAAIIALTLYVTNRQATQLAQEEHARIALWADATQSIATNEQPAQDYTFVLRVIEENHSVPVVLTDANRYVLASRNLPARYAADPDLLHEYVEALAEEHPPIVITLPSGEQNFILYGSSSTLKELRYYPYLQLLFIAAIGLLGYWLVRQNRQAEQGRIWVGMAKETAHQLGTPISSLIAWTQLLEEDQHMPELTAALTLDIERLQRVANRFSKIGAKPQLDDFDLHATILSSVEYMRPRIPRAISLAYLSTPDCPLVPHNSILIQWVTENLIRNSVDAITGQGSISLKLYFNRKGAIIECKDTGCGMSRSLRRAIFRPGYSTKTRGWGLGLSLAKRIVNGYHRGRIYVAKSEIGKGTKFRILLPLR